MALMRKASRKRTKARIGFAGPSGAGKTMSALLTAYGLTGSWDKVGMIDTEMGSGELYVGTAVKGLNITIGEYNYIRIDPPYSATKYLDAIKEMEAAGIEAIVVDSLTHAWAGSGGLLDKHGKLTDASKSKNSWTAWRTVTPEHNALVDAMLLSKSHIIATVRSKQEYAQVKDDNTGRMVVEKLGMAPIQREGMEYEFTVFFDIDIGHTAHASKDRTTIFDGLYFKVSPDTGKKYIEWMMSGKLEAEIAPLSPTVQTEKFSSVSEKIKEELAQAFTNTTATATPTPQPEQPPASQVAPPQQEQPQPPATPPPAQPPAQPPVAPPASSDKKILPAQLKYIMTKMQNLLVKPGKCDMETAKTCLHDAFKVESTKDIKASQFNAASAWIEEFAKESTESK